MNISNSKPRKTAGLKTLVITGVMTAADSFSVAAFHTGLMKRTEELAKILEKDEVLYHNGYTSGELRKLLVKSGLPSFINEDELYGLAERIVNLSRDGLRQRGFGEEKFLSPLYERINNRTNPAKKLFERLNSGEDLEEIIKDYAKINRVG